MKNVLVLVLLTILLCLPSYAQAPDSAGNPSGTQQSGLMILSKRGSGPITRNRLSLTLGSGPGCDQTQSRIPDGSRMVSDDFSLNVNNGGLGTFHGSVKIVSASGENLQVGVLRGTVGINDCEPTAGTVCTAVCNKPWHLEGIYEPVPTFAPNPNGQIVIANFKADLNLLTASPLPIYRARLDGWFAVPPTVVPRVMVAPEKFNYLKEETISVKITNASEKTIQGNDLKSRCTILELQRQENERWITSGQCFLRRASFPVNIKPGETLQVDLQPSSAAAPILPGVYRLALVFRVLEDEKVNSDFFVAFSPLLRITAMPQRDGVSVSVESERYIVGQAVKVKVDNNTDRAIQTFDHQTGCSIVTVQRFKDGNWSSVAECPLLSPTRLVKIASRQMIEAKISEELPGVKLEPGTYRIEFSYNELDINEQNPGPEVKRYSPQFTITQRN